MKISIITPTYNRGELLKKLYDSLKKNSNYGFEIEWLIMDDGSIDNTKETVDEFIKENVIRVIYQYQKNQGKMAAINNIIDKATGELLIEADSDDYFLDDAFEIIYKRRKKILNNNEIYALIFPKKMNNMNTLFNKTNYISTMFDLYYKERLDCETTIVFKTDIRKKFKYKLEHNERFVTESRMYHEIDLQYKVMYINKNIQKCEYIADGYTKNIQGIFLKNPFGYYEFFKELINRNLKGVTFSKKLYIYKHYILFSYLTKNKKYLKNINSLDKKIIIFILYIPGIIKSKKFKNKSL